MARENGWTVCGFPFSNISSKSAEPSGRRLFPPRSRRFPLTVSFCFLYPQNPWRCLCTAFAVYCSLISFSKSLVRNNPRNSVAEALLLTQFFWRHFWYSLHFCSFLRFLRIPIADIQLSVLFIDFPFKIFGQRLCPKVAREQFLLVTPFRAIFDTHRFFISFLFFRSPTCWLDSVCINLLKKKSFVKKNFARLAIFCVDHTVSRHFFFARRNENGLKPRVRTLRRKFPDKFRRMQIPITISQIPMQMFHFGARGESTAISFTVSAAFPILTALFSLADEGKGRSWGQ